MHTKQLAYSETISQSQSSKTKLSGFPRKHSSSPLRFLGTAFDLLILLLVGGFMCLWGLNNNSFGNGDQTIHAKVVQEFLYYENWMYPTREGKLYLTKPPFKMWLSALALKVLGQSNASYRILDGLSGVGTILCTYWLGRLLFASRLIGLFGALGLMGCRIFYFGHGVRVAVQDSMLLLFTTLALILSWKLIQEIEKSKSSAAKLYLLAISGGVLIGLAMLTKNIVGYLAFVIWIIYVLLSGRTLLVLKKAWKPVTLGLLTSIVIPLAYLIPQYLKWKSGIISLMFKHEIYKRATQGYHHKHVRFFYFEEIFDDLLTVPPTLLSAAMLWALWCIFRHRDQRYFFILVWAVVPVLVFSLARSRLEWYIMPSLPAMGLLIGAAVSTLLIYVAQRIPKWIFLRRSERGFVVAGCIASIYALGLLSYYVLDIAYDIYSYPETNRTTTDKTISWLQEKIPGLPKPDIALEYEAPRLSHAEIFYWEMAGATWNITNDQLAEKLNTNAPLFILTSPNKVASIVALHPIAGYRYLQPYDERRRWLAMLSLRPEFLPPTFEPAVKHLDLGHPDLAVAYGLKPREQFHGHFIRVGLGSGSGVLLEGDAILATFGSTFQLRAASTAKNNEHPLLVDVFLNNRKLTQLTFPTEGFVVNSWEAVPGDWKRGKNLLSFSYRFENNKEISSDQGLVLFDWLDITVGDSNHPMAIPLTNAAEDRD